MARLQGVPGGQLLRAGLWVGEPGDKGTGGDFFICGKGLQHEWRGQTVTARGRVIWRVELEALEAVEAERFINRMAGSRREVDGSRGSGRERVHPDASRRIRREAC